MDNYFTELNNINVNEHTERKNNLTYLSWAWAWQEIKKLHPNANYKVYEREDGCIYWTDGRTAWVKTGVTINDIEHIEYLPIMDYRNQSIPLEKITSFDVNKSIQRSLTKACARHGLGLYIYAGEDLPDGQEPAPKPARSDFEKQATAEKKALNKAVKEQAAEAPQSPVPLSETGAKLLDWLNSLTKETYETKANSAKDKAHDVRDALLSSNVPELTALGVKIADRLKDFEPELDDEIVF